MKNKKFLITIITLIVVSLCLLSFYFVVRLNIFPELTNKFNQLSAKVFLPKDNPSVDDAVPLKKDKIILDSGKISIKNLKQDFVFIDKSEIEKSDYELQNFENDFKIDDVEFVLSENNSALTVTGVLSRFLSYYNEDNPQITTWTYKNNFPIITHPGIYQNLVVFIDGSLKVHILDLITGNEINIFDCPVYPLGPALAIHESYVFQGLDENFYAIAFSDYALLKINQLNQNACIENPFTLTEDVYNKILDNVNNWLTTKDNIILPQAEVYPFGFNPLPVNIDNPFVLVYSPDKQGVYTLGLCDEQQAFITTYAFVAVFTSTGELRGVSMDYVADRPNIEIHLSDDEIYYIVMCKLDQNTDSQQMYFTVK